MRLRHLFGDGARQPARDPDLDPEVVLLPVSAQGRDVLIVLGMRWHTILGRDLAAQARRKVRQHGASHWVHAGGRSESVGTVRLVTRRFGGPAGVGRKAASRLPANREAHSAAQLFARGAGGGTHALAWQLENGRCWLALVRDGQVLSEGDTVFDSAQQAGAALLAAQARFGELRYHGAATTLLADQSCVSEDAGEPPFALAQLASGLGAASILQSRRIAWSGARGALLGLLMLGITGWLLPTTWEDLRRPAREVDAPYDALPQAQASPEQLWRHALADFRTRTRLPGAQGLDGLWREVAALPLRPSGWLLREVQCAVAHADAWHCAAHYRRQLAHADNAGLVRRLQTGAGRELSWTSLDDATATFAVRVDTVPWQGHPRAEEVAAFPARDAGGEAGRQTRYFPHADALQDIRRLFSRVEVGPPQAVAVAAPRGDDGAQLAVPDGWSLPTQRAVRVHGPLRSMALLDASLNGRIAWNQLSLTVDPAARVDIASSPLVATLSGVSYEE